MPSFYLQSTDDEGVTTTKSFNGNYIDDVVDHVQDFLKGSGFCFNDLRVIKAYDRTDYTNPRVIAELEHLAGEERN
tara:strand:- start:567 stop:794 length:228 start_codon:yes stop_codon:yes gene_type:complete